MFSKTVCVRFIDNDKQKYVKRAEELGYKAHNNDGVQHYDEFIKLYHETKSYNTFTINQVSMENEITQEEFFGTIGLDPKDVFEIVKNLGYDYICQNGIFVWAVKGKLEKSAYGRFDAIGNHGESKLLTVTVNWPDKENMVYPPLPIPKTIEVKLNNEYGAKIHKDKIEVGCQTFPISILEQLNKALAELNK